MTLRIKANLVFAAALVIALGLAILLVAQAGHHARMAWASQEAAVMTAEADALSHYTQQEVAPLIGARDQGLLFVPQSTPFHAIEAVSRIVAQTMPGTSLRRVVLDPTGSADRPDAWERQALDRVVASPDAAPLLLQRTTATGPEVVLASPIRMSDGICATCYTSRSAAPEGVLDAFGGNKGFDRKAGQIIGATLASVPLASAPGSGAGVAILTLLLLAVILWVAFNAILHSLVLAPVARMGAIADDVSVGRLDVAEFPAGESRELASLGRSFTRLRRSVETAMARFEP